MNNFEKLKNAILDEDFYVTNMILENIYNEDNAFEYIPKLLKIMEENPELDYGIPGPIVHFMEKFYKKGYEKLLLSSVQQRPTYQTLWMINRIINDPNLNDKTKYIEVLKETSNRMDISETIRTVSKDYYNFQTNNK